MEFIYDKIFISTLKHKYKIGGNKMDKDEILKRSKKNSKHEDEFFVRMRLTSSSLGLGAILILLTLIVISPLFGVLSTVMIMDKTFSLSEFSWFLISIYMAIDSAYRYKILRKKFDLIWTFIFLFNIISFIFKLI